MYGFFRKAWVSVGTRLLPALLLCTTLPAGATLVFYEGFDYPPGALAGNAGGTGFAAEWVLGSGSGNVVADGLTYTDTNGAQLQVSGGAYSGPGGAFFRDLASVLDANTTGTYWLSYLVRTSGNATFSGLSFFDGNPENLFTGHVGVGEARLPRYRIHSYAPGSATITTSSADPAWVQGQADFIVVRLDLNAQANSDSIYLWVNPLLEPEPQTSTALLQMHNREVLGTRIRMGHNAAASMDELRFGTTWASVAPTGPPTAVVMGDVSLWIAAAGDFLHHIGARRDDGANLLALLRSWDPETALSLSAAGPARLWQALLDYLDADGDGRVAVLRWDTLEERGTVGFYVERRSATSPHWVRVNAMLLPAMVAAPMGAEYQLADPGALSGVAYEYRLIELEARGTTREYGPFPLHAGD